jgi:Protein of unknown function (DUF3489)
MVSSEPPPAPQAATPAPQVAPKPAKKAKAAKAPTRAADASTPRVPRAFSKQAIVRDMLLRAGGATLQEIMAETGWQKHTSGASSRRWPRRPRFEITSTRRESEQARVYEAAK